MIKGSHGVGRRGAAIASSDKRYEGEFSSKAPPLCLNKSLDGSDAHSSLRQMALVCIPYSLPLV